ncbi:DNA dC-_dU-editing enzyme APOBEC-3H-like isoform 1-T2 [Urocitellus parryii]|uniref:single-stranded DNA cytosine deaminase n=2 Tax=Urocitellus parryii TaxID=9999 RepID=A0A8D2IHI7_UROPR
MKLLKKETFHLQFNNQHRAPWPYHRRKTYLCYQLRLQGSPCDQDYFQNKKGHHAEIRFIKKIRSLDLDQSQNYEVTCYLTWSPCPDCAQELVALTRSHPHVRLRLFTSRLYFHWFWSFQEGLRLLWRSGVQIRVMSLREFTHCWVKFVNHGGCPFEPELWDGLEHRSQSIQNRLNRILGLPPVTATCATSCPHPCCSAVLSLQDLTANFRNLQL